MIIFWMLVRMIFALPVLFVLLVMYRLSGDPDALDAAGNLICMWMMAGKLAECEDILYLAIERGNVKLGIWFDQQRKKP